jgi:uncharacterized membrane protein required for colicin V production
MKTTKEIIQEWENYQDFLEGYALSEEILYDQPNFLFERQILIEGPIDWIKNKVKDFSDWKDARLKGFIEGTLEKIIGVLDGIRSAALAAETPKKIKNLINNFLSKDKHKTIKAYLKTFMMEKYLKIGAAVLNFILKRIMSAGAAALLAATGVGAGAAAAWVAENFSIVKDIIQFISNYVDPQELLQTIEAAVSTKETAADVIGSSNLNPAQFLSQFNTDLRRSAFSFML